MKFFLVYRGPLPSSGNNSKPKWVARIREQFHPQMKLLWETHRTLKHLRSSAIVSRGGQDLALTNGPFDELRDPDRPLAPHEVDLCAALDRNGRYYRPLVRQSLDLNCSICVLFLRQEDPGSLVMQGGDLDGRIKTLLDALTVPLPEVENMHPAAQQETYCLMESDSLVCNLEVETGRLLAPASDGSDEVEIVVDIEINLLRVGEWNVCLLGR